MLSQNSTLAALFAAPVRPGRVVWIGVRPGRREPMVIVDTVIAQAGKGLTADRYKTTTNGPRQVTLIQVEDLTAMASYLGRDLIDPSLLRRNIVVQGINLRALKNKRFIAGTALLEYSGECHPCSRMEENLGTGGYNAVRGHGGITARVIMNGTVAVGDSVIAIAGAS